MNKWLVVLKWYGQSGWNWDVREFSDMEEAIKTAKAFAVTYGSSRTVAIAEVTHDLTIEPQAIPRSSKAQ